MYGKVKCSRGSRIKTGLATVGVPHHRKLALLIAKGASGCIGKV